MRHTTTGGIAHELGRDRFVLPTRETSQRPNDSILTKDHTLGMSICVLGELPKLDHTGESYPRMCSDLHVVGRNERPLIQVPLP